jgi:vacuolar protein sorting-associated protein 45
MEKEQEETQNIMGGEGRELSMDLLRATRHYINKMLESVDGMKVLLLDAETTGLVSMAYTHSEILEKDVFLFDRLDAADRETMMHLKALLFIRPSESNVDALAAELAEPKYSEYYVFFSNVVSTSLLQKIAAADRHQCVKGVREYFADFFTVNRDLFTLNIDSCISLVPSTHQRILVRICDGLSAVLLALKKQPVIRYQRNSELAQRVSQELARRMVEEQQLFECRRDDVSPVLLIVDRRSDPVTPLLSQWTYQAMVHDCFGIANNRVRVDEGGGTLDDWLVARMLAADGVAIGSASSALASSSSSSSLSPLDDLDDYGSPSTTSSSSSSSSAAAASSSKPKAEVVLSPEHDEFYRHNMYLNWGELGVNIKTMMQRVQSADKSNRNIASIEDMKRFIENFPQFKKLKGNVSKHVLVLGALSGAVGARKLLKVSALEQELACKNDHSEALSGVTELLQTPGITEFDRLKIVMLYALRYEGDSSNATKELFTRLERTGVPRDALGLIPALLRYAGASQRTGSLFGDTDWISRLSSKIKSGLRDVDNIYTQHKPLLNNMLQDLFKARLSEADYPAMAGGNTHQRPRQVIVFFVGGATFEEAYTVARINREFPGVSVILGGSTIHNAQSFLADIQRLRNVLKS